MAFGPMVPAPGLPAPIQFAPPPQMKPGGIGPQGMAILQAALKGRPQVGAVDPNAAVNPGSPPPVGDPAYFPGGQGPMAGGAAMPQVGMLARLLQGMGVGGVQPQPVPGDIGG